MSKAKEDRFCKDKARSELVGMRFAVNSFFEMSRQELQGQYMSVIPNTSVDDMETLSREFMIHRLVMQHIANTLQVLDLE